jgi:hypothetical protein
MARIIVLAMLVLAVGGCASYTWYKADTPTDVARSDERECREQAWAVASEYNTWSGPFWGPGFDWPAASPGWSGYDPSWRADAEQRAVDRCMEVKGYKLVKQPGR